MKNDYPILALCAHLEVSPSGYYGWQQRRATPSLRAVENQTLAKEIGQIHAQSRHTYGSPRIVDALRKQGRRHGRNRIARLMQQAGLRGRQKARYRVQTTDSHHDRPIAPNRLATAPKATAPNQLWVADTRCVSVTATTRQGRNGTTRRQDDGRLDYGTLSQVVRSLGSLSSIFRPDAVRP